MYKSLEKNWDRSEPIPPIKKYKKPELWQMTQRKKSSEFYIIDRMPAERGHKVITWVTIKNANIQHISYSHGY